VAQWMEVEASAPGKSQVSVTFIEQFCKCCAPFSMTAWIALSSPQRQRSTWCAAPLGMNALLATLSATISALALVFQFGSTDWKG